MSALAMSGDDTLTLNKRPIVDLADGDVGTLTFPNGLVEVSVGKNGNAMFALNNKGKMAEQMIKVVRGSPDDKYMQSQMTTMENNFPGYVLMVGQFVKVLGDGVGNITNDTYVMSSGVVAKRVEAKSNSDGETGQNTVEYHIKWAKAVRVIA